MTQFVKLALAEYDQNGIPEDLDADDQWINRDHIQRIRERVAHDHARAHATGRQPSYYPAIELTMSSGEEHLVFLGPCPCIDDAEDAIRRFLPLLLEREPAPTTEDAIGSRNCVYCSD